MPTPVIKLVDWQLQAICASIIYSSMKHNSVLSPGDAAKLIIKESKENKEG